METVAPTVERRARNALFTPVSDVPPGDPRAVALEMRDRVLDIDAQLLQLFHELGAGSALDGERLRPISALIDAREHALRGLGEWTLRNLALVDAPAQVAASLGSTEGSPLEPTPPDSAQRVAESAPASAPTNQCHITHPTPTEIVEPAPAGNEATLTAPRGQTAASPAAVDEFCNRFAARKRPYAPATAPPLFDERVALKKLLEQLGSPPALESGAETGSEFDLLVLVTVPEAREIWKRLPENRQVTYLELIVARLRAAQERRDAPSKSHRIVHALRDYLHTERPGLVHGLALDHRPRHGSWSADTTALGDDLASALRPAPKARTITTLEARVARSILDKGDAIEDPPAAAPAFEAWSYLAPIAGTKALMFGGDPRPSSAEAIRLGLRLAALEWMDGGKPRLVDSVVERVAGHAYGVVFINKFASHQDTNRLIEACKRAGVPYAVLRHGHGLQAVKSALDRALGDRSSDDTGHLPHASHRAAV